ncbi:MAG: hypothetical protein DMG08_30405, partial [Acidobacteria bacterium]
RYGDGTLTLEQEVACEPEAVVIAFKNVSRVYFFGEYRSRKESKRQVHPGFSVYQRQPVPPE